MLPFQPSSAFFSSQPLLEVQTFQQVLVTGEWYDTIDYLPAQHVSVPVLNQLFDSDNPDPRFFVSYAVQGTGWNLGFGANHTRCVLLLETSNALPVPAASTSQIVPLNEAATLTVGNGFAASRDQNGVLRVNGRFVRVLLEMSGDVPTGLDFAFGAYLRVV